MSAVSTEPATSGAVTARRYHYIITLQFESRNGVQGVVYEHGVYAAARDQKRQEVFQAIFQKAAQAGSGANPVPLFFSLEPDDLT